VNQQELKNLIREELLKALKVQAPAPPQEGRGEERRVRNQAVIARWLRNEGGIPSINHKISRRLGVKIGSRPWHNVGEDSSARGHQAFGTTKATESRYNLIPHPKNAELLKNLLRTTSARLGVWRAGTRPLTKVLLDFQADHAIAKRAVYEQFPPEKVRELGLFEVQSLIKNKEEFLLRPDLGRQLKPESAEAIRAQCVQNPDVQLIFSDGLSGLALETNIKELLPALTRELQGKGYSVGTPVYCNFARVALQDRIGEIVQAKTCVILIGERPGLGTGDGLSAYLIYKPNAQSTHANRNCISNIHPRGLDPHEAARYIEFTVTKMMEQQTSGVDLDLH